MGKIKKYFQCALSIALIITIFTYFFKPFQVEAEEIFKGELKGAYFEEAVNSLLKKGVIAGHTDGTFKPNNNITRAEVAKIVAYDLGLTLSESASIFKDVKPDAWYYQPVTALAKAGGVVGFQDGNFMPDKTITRAEMASILVKAYALKNTGEDKPVFTDVKSTSWYANAVQILLQNNVTSGKGKNVFAPDDRVTRGEAAAFVYKASKFRSFEIESVKDNSVIISGREYKYSADYSGLFNKNNADILKKANIKFELSNGDISKVTYLQINSSGFPSEEDREFSNNLVIDAQKNTVHGDVYVNANFITVKGMQVIGDFKISENLLNDFYGEDIVVQGNTIVNGGDDNTVVFSDATLQNLEINKHDVRIESLGKTSIGEVVVNASSTIVAGQNNVISKITLMEDAKQVELNGMIASLHVVNTKSVTINGSGVIENLVLATPTNLTLNRQGSIGNLEISNNNASVNLVNSVNNLRINNVTIVGGNISDIVIGFDSVKGQIGKVNDVPTIAQPSNSNSGDSSYTLNRAPIATNVSISGIQKEGQTLIGSYTYLDAENNPEGVTTFKWYRADNSNGTNKVVIAGATSTQYLLTNADIGKYISFEVTPIASTGTLTGTPVTSNAAVGPIKAVVFSFENSTLSMTGEQNINKTATYTLTAKDEEGDPIANYLFNLKLAILDKTSSVREVVTVDNTTYEGSANHPNFHQLIDVPIGLTGSDGRITVVITYMPGGAVDIGDSIFPLWYDALGNQFGESMIKTQTPANLIIP